MITIVGKITTADYIKSNKKASREEEISAYGHPLSFNRVFKSKKQYSRKDKHKNNRYLSC